MSLNALIMPCMDVQKGRVVKGVRFVDIKDAGDPVACCRAYCAAGANELAMLDITATVENRPTLIDVVKRVAAVKTVPLTIGGGIKDVSSAEIVLKAGAGYADSFGKAASNVDGSFYDTAIGVLLQVPIGNREARARHARAMLTREQFAEALDNLQQLVELDVRTAYIEVKRTREQVAESK